jgi:hypothetical protein
MRSKKVQERHNQVKFCFIEYINTLGGSTCLEMSVAGRLAVLFLSLIVMTTGFAATAFADSHDIAPLSVKTELPLYDQGDSVKFTGQIKTLADNPTDVTIRILGPLVNGTGNMVQVAQITPQLDGSFEGFLVVTGPQWVKKGDYKIMAFYGGQKAETTFFYNGGTGSDIIDTPPPPPPPKCGEGEILKDNQCVPFTPPPPTCGPGTHLEGNVCVADAVDCEPGKILVNGQCVDEQPDTTGPVCGPGTHAENGICVPDKTGGPSGCLIATAAFGSELAPQVQLLREVRDNVLFSTSAGTSFMGGFNSVYYAFSPTVADWERSNPAFKEIVKTAITPMLSTLSILNYVEIDSESKMLGYGIGIILLNIGMYFFAPAIVLVKLKGYLSKIRA